MDRLTINLSNGHAGIKEHTPDQEVYDRLAAYEDTGYEPRQFEDCVDAMKAALYDLQTEFEAYKALGDLSHLRELVKAEKDGRLVVQDIFTLFPIECSDKCEKYIDDRIGCEGLEAAVTAPGGEWPFMIKTCPKEVVRTKATQEKLQLARSGKADKDGARFFLTREAAEVALEGDNNETNPI